jgi:virulence-associated protein VapD|tara:strand:+ start:272 stop:460 length:189 start_codon:yes stop_codon:yes gene_type:complete
MVNNYLLKEVSDEALDLKKQLQKYKVDFKQGNLSQEETISNVENMIRISQIIYAKLTYLDKL